MVGVKQASHESCISPSLQPAPGACLRVRSLRPAGALRAGSPEGAAMGGGLARPARHRPGGLHDARWTHKTSPAMHAAPA